MSQYDFFIAGRWRNYPTVKAVLEAVRRHNKTGYCFIENLYEDSKIEFRQNDSIEVIMQKLEALPADDELVKQIFDNDMRGEKTSDNFVLVLPAGISGHIEAGVAYGLGKKCYAIGQPDKTETLYQIFDKVFPSVNEFEDWLTNISTAV